MYEHKKQTCRKVIMVSRGSCSTSTVLWFMPGILHREHGLGVRMLIPPTLILVQLSSAKGPHPRTTMLSPHQREW